MEIRNFIKKNKILLISIFIVFAITLLFPYSGDDWQWSIGELSINRIIGFSKNAALNGRYLGNIFVILLTKNTILRGLIFSLVLCSIVHLISKKENIKTPIIWLLILLMPLELFKQSIVWASGFANYVISTLFLLFCIILIEKTYKSDKFNIKLACLNILVFYLSSLFIENMTIFLVLLTFMLNGLYLIKNKKLNTNLLFALLGSIFGALTMFIHPSYLNVLGGNDGYRTLANANTSIFARAFSNFSEVIYKFIAFDNVILLLLIIGILFISFYKRENKFSHKKLIYSLFGIEFLYILYAIMMHLNTNWKPLLNYTLKFNCLITILFIIIMLILIQLIFSKKAKRVWFVIITIIGMVAPLLVVTPLGGRNFFTIYILEMILAFELYQISGIKTDKKVLAKVIYLSLAFMTLYYTSIYGYIKLVSIRRDNYIEKMKNQAEDNIIVVPKLPYNKFVWVPDFSNDYYKSIYKYKKNVPNNVDIKFIDYDSWRIEYYK